jgi:ubiquitin-protein ligase
VSALHQRRVANELELLERLAALNPDKVRLTDRAIHPDSSRVGFELLASPALVSAGALAIETTHAVEMRFTRFFPAVPIEVYLHRPVFHPNVDPGSGFVCLWHQFSPDDTCVDAIDRLRQVLAWELVNPSPQQVIQPEAFAWWNESEQSQTVPLALVELARPEPERPFAPRFHAIRRRRLD